MGNCIYCGKPAGFLRRKHRECAQKRKRGSFRGRPVEVSQKVLVDRGILAVTTKHLYFHGQKKVFRVR